MRAGDTHFGYLSISEGRRQLDDLDLLAVESGATVAAFHLSRERAVQESVRSQRALMLYELLNDRSEDVERRRQHAHLLDFDVDDRVSVVVIAFNSETRETREDNWARQLQAVLTTTDTTLARLNLRRCLVVAEGAGLLLVIPDGFGKVEETVSSLMNDARAHHRLPAWSAGISSATQLNAGLAHAHAEAKSAARLGFSIKGASSITRYDSLGVLRILGEIREDSVERHLSSTLTDDPNFRHLFFETFGAFANAGYNKAAAARTIFVHVNTLKYRLERIKQVTGQDPFDHRGRFALECSLRLMELQVVRSPSG